MGFNGHQMSWIKWSLVLVINFFCLLVWRLDPCEVIIKRFLGWLSQAKGIIKHIGQYLNIFFTPWVSTYELCTWRWAMVPSFLATWPTFKNYQDALSFIWLLKKFTLLAQVSVFILFAVVESLSCVFNWIPLPGLWKEPMNVWLLTSKCVHVTQFLFVQDSFVSFSSVFWGLCSSDQYLSGGVAIACTSKWTETRLPTQE